MNRLGSQQLKLRLLLDFLWVFLFPISCLWMWVMIVRRNYLPTYRAVKSKLPVVCVGNIHSGGSGKTPIVKLLIQKLESQSPVLLARGYGGKLCSTGVQVDPKSESGCLLYGDEPWMIAKQMGIPVFIGKNRRKLLQMIEQEYPQSSVIMDDGFQRLSIKKDVSLVCINSDKKITDNFCLPLGELREPLSAIGAADAVVLTPGTDLKNSISWRQLISTHFPSIPIFEAQREFEGFFEGSRKLDIGLEERAVSFCGIASPERFVSTLREIHPSTQHLKSFSDHHDYSSADVTDLINQGRLLGAKLFITTDKDWFKVAPHFFDPNLKLASLRQSYSLSEEFWSWISKKLGRQII